VSRPVTPGVGATFGDYAIESVLGRGGMGTVFLATQRRLGRRVALKVIAPELALDEEFRARFLRESQLAASLDHPNVIPIYDADEVDGALYLAMRYVSGPSLQTLLRERGTLSPTETLRVAEQIGGALDAAHKAGLVHRDVKPANILLAESGEHAYLCDFGLAKRTTSRELTRTGFFLGTADYSAPEQIEGRPLDGRADIYSLGCLLFHCLAGRPPFVRETEIAVLNAHLQDPPPALSSVRSDLPHTLDDVLASAMAKSPDDRYPTGAALADALGKAVGGEAPVTRAAPVTVRLRRSRRLRGRLIAGVILVLAIAAAVAAVLATRSSDNAAGNPRLRTFVERIENVLEQSASGRGDLNAAITSGLNCKISAVGAAQRIASAADNRESILVQLGSLSTPTQQADNVVTLLQRALQQSIEADRHYRDGFATIAPGTSCPLPANPDFQLAERASERATAAKQRFVGAFDPLAKSFKLRTWSAGDF
jgi:serine/threonine-protein kinase